MSSGVVFMVPALGDAAMLASSMVSSVMLVVKAGIPKSCPLDTSTTYASCMLHARILARCSFPCSLTIGEWG